MPPAAGGARWNPYSAEQPRRPSLPPLMLSRFQELPRPASSDTRGQAALPIQVSWGQAGLGRKPVDVWLQHRIDEAVYRRRNTMAAAKLNHLAGEPGQLEPIAAQ
jgi:hypothetical protein